MKAKFLGMERYGTSRCSNKEKKSVKNLYHGANLNLNGKPETGNTQKKRSKSMKKYRI